MDGNNWGAAQAQISIPGQSVNSDSAGVPAIENGDWRTQLQADSRHRIVNKIMETLKRHLPFSGQEGLQELQKIAIRFEEKIFTAASSQSDYLRRISLKMLTMETKCATNSKNPQDPASQPMQSQMPNQVQPISMSMVANSSQGRQPLLSQNIQSNLTSAGAPSSTPFASAHPGGMPNVSGQSPNIQTIQNMSTVTPSAVGNSMGQVNSEGMDGNNWRSSQIPIPIPGQSVNSEAAGVPAIENGDWRAQLRADSRLRNVNKIMEILKRHLPFSGEEGLQELEKVALRFEEKIFTAASTQSDYLRRISLKMSSMETKFATNSENPQDPDESYSCKL